ncbi:FAD-dependent oxidoreductase [Azospirillum brasilense]|uniref:FAD-dependent oxidoreductase n=1 Tax=Azospirillum brasilense TaxID=192 RepID=UPI001EDB93DD|nr:FAD-dependent oxidoreductase [Azospirillum brasilense]
MPVLPCPPNPESVTLPPRRAMKVARCHVLVVGGGPAGMGAAIGAAQSGADTILVERYGFLGGNATAALVMPWMSFYTQRGSVAVVDNTRLMPQDHGPGEPVVGGALAVFLGRLYTNQGAIPPSPDTGFTVPFDPEVLKVTAQQILDEAGVKVLLHAFASTVLGEPGKPDAVVFETKSGPVVIEADVIVDCTGDGDIAALAGCDYEVGREEDGLTQPMTLMFRMVGFDHDAFNGYVREHPTQWRGVHGLWDLVSKATANGDLDLAREDILFFATTHPGEIALNCTRVTGALGTNVFDLTHAEWESHRQAAQIANFLRKYAPGFADAYTCQTGTGIGIRETRRIVGDYAMTADDVLGAAKFKDAIARGTYPVDIHSPTGRGTVLKRVPSGEWYEVPMRALLPKGTEKLLVAGRCISGSHEAHSSYRVTPTCMATGQAAGICASMAARRGERTRDIPVGAIQRELLRQGALLREPEA